MILNHLPIFAYSGVLKCDMKIFVNVARLEIGQLFTQGTGYFGHISGFSPIFCGLCFRYDRLYQGIS